MRRIDLDWIESFIAVADLGGFTWAARSLHRAQSRVSAHVAALEQVLGGPLFDRRYRPPQLTEIGETFLPRARSIVSSVQAAVAEVDALSGRVRGTVVVGTHPSISAGVMPQLLARFRRQYPEVTVDLTERTTARLAETLLDGTVDIAVRATSADNDDRELSSYPLWSEPFVAVLPVDHPLASDDGPVDPTELLAHHLVAISPPAGALEPELAVLAEKWGIRPELAWRTEQPQAVVNLVKAGLGVGLLNYLAMETSETTGLRWRRVSDDISARTVSAWWNPRRRVSPATRAFFTALRAFERPAGTYEVDRPDPPDWA